MDEPWRLEEVGKQVRSRSVNEGVLAILHGERGGWAPREFVCECGEGACSELIRLTVVEYEAVRADGRWFAVALNHEDPEAETVLAETAAYATVEKLPGAGGRLAAFTDPRL